MSQHLIARGQVPFQFFGIDDPVAVLITIPVVAVSGGRYLVVVVLIELDSSEGIPLRSGKICNVER